MKTTTGSILWFMLKAAAVVLPIVVVAAVWYVCADPYKVVRDYDVYFPDPEKCPVRVGINKGLITITNYEHQVAAGRRYNAFIFGSSISCYYDARRWAEMLGSEAPASPYHFDSSSETLAKMADKVEYLDHIGQPMEYALIVLDPIIMGHDDSSGPSTINPPQLHRSVLERIKYHYTFFRAATNADFYKSWIPYRLTGKGYDNGRNLVFSPQPIVYDPTTNQETMPQWDSLIASDAAGFYSRYPLAESPERVVAGKAVLTPVREAALRRVAEVFARQHTDYQVIIGPNRMKVALSQADLALLRQIFDAKRVHDFSSSMAEALECDTLLYDNTHYRPVFATELMERVYR